MKWIFKLKYKRDLLIVIERSVILKRRSNIRAVSDKNRPYTIEYQYICQPFVDMHNQYMYYSLSNRHNGYASDRLKYTSHPLNILNKHTFICCSYILWMLNYSKHYFFATQTKIAIVVIGHVLRELIFSALLPHIPVDLTTVKYSSTINELYVITTRVWRTKL